MKMISLHLQVRSHPFSLGNLIHQLQIKKLPFLHISTLLLSFVTFSILELYRILPTFNVRSLSRCRHGFGSAFLIVTPVFRYFIGNVWHHPCHCRLHSKLPLLHLSRHRHLRPGFLFVLRRFLSLKVSIQHTPFVKYGFFI